MKTIKILSLSLLFFASSCATTKSTTTTQSFNLESSAWQLEQLKGEPLTEVTPESYVVRFGQDNRLSGKGECNVIMGSYSQESATALSISNFGMTRMICPNMEREAAYMQLLESVTSFEVVDNKLLLFNGDNLLARFKAIEEK